MSKICWQTLTLMFLVYSAPALSSGYDPSFSCQDGPLALKLPTTLPKIMALGAVLKSKDSPPQNYTDYKVTERWLQFQGLDISFFVFSNNSNRYLLSSVKVTSERWNISPIRVGQIAKKRLTRDGWPEVPFDGKWELGGDANTLSVSVSKGIITDFSYSCDAD